MGGRTSTSRRRAPDEAQADQAFAAAGVAMAQLDLEGRITSVNPAFEVLLDTPAADLAGRELMDLVHPQDASAVRGGRLTSFRSGTIRADLRFVRGDGATLWARISISLGRSAGGAAAFLVASMEDVGDLKAAEAGLRQALLYDQDTSMPTHRLFEDRVEVALKAASRTAGQVLVGIVRLAPDAPLLIAAERLAGTVRVSDTVARIGHREFAVLMPDGSAEGFERALPLDAVAAAGVAIYPENGEDAHSLIAAAQLAATPLAAAPVAPPAEDDEIDEDAAVRLQALEPVSLFLSQPEQVLRRIARYTSRQTTAAGEELVLEFGSPSLRIVEEGLFEVIPEGHELAIMTLAPSDFIGTEHHEGGPLSVRLRAVTATRILVLEHEALERIAPAGSPLRATIRDAVQRRTHQFRRLAERGRPVEGARAATVAVYSTKGGAGRTTIAMNLAAELGARYPGEVLLVDMSLPYNHVALLANLVPTTCLARLSGLDAWAMPGAIRGALLGHADGFMVLPSALRPEEAELVTAELVVTALNHLTPLFRHVVIDLGMALSDPAIACIEHADRLFVVATPELAAMHDTRAFLDIAGRVLHVPASAVEILLNHPSPQSALDARGVERVLGRNLTAEFRYVGGRSESTGLAGMLLVRQQQPSPFGRVVKDLAERLEQGRASRSA